MLFRERFKQRTLIDETVIYEIRPERILYMKEWALDYKEVPL